MTFFVCVFTAKSVALSLFIIPVKRLNMDVLEGCDVEGGIITKSSKGFINYTLFLSRLELFAKSVPDSVARPLVLVYDGCCIHYNDDIVKKQLSLRLYSLY